MGTQKWDAFYAASFRERESNPHVVRVTVRLIRSPPTCSIFPQSSPARGGCSYSRLQSREELPRGRGEADRPDAAGEVDRSLEVQQRHVVVQRSLEYLRHLVV